VRQVRWLAAALLVWAAPLAAQPVVGAKAGLISFGLGKVYLDNQAVEISAARFAEWKQNAVLRTEGGRAEVLLGPCAVLRVDEDSSLKMLDTDLVHPAVGLVDGAAVVDIAGIRKGGAIAVRLGAAQVTMARIGTYRFDFAPLEVKVFAGRADVERDGKTLTIGAGRMLAFDAKAPEKFDIRAGDGLDLWNRERAAVAAKARGRGEPSMIDLAWQRDTSLPDASQARGPNTMPPPGVRRRPAPPDAGCRL
jgi:hypothetical protein